MVVEGSGGARAHIGHHEYPKSHWEGPGGLLRPFPNQVILKKAARARKGRASQVPGKFGFLCADVSDGVL